MGVDAPSVGEGAAIGDAISIKTRQALLRAGRVNAQDMCVVGSNKDNISNGYAA